MRSCRVVGNHSAISLPEEELAPDAEEFGGLHWGERRLVLDEVADLPSLLCGKKFVKLFKIPKLALASFHVTSTPKIPIFFGVFIL